MAEAQVQRAAQEQRREKDGRPLLGEAARQRLLAGMPVTERRLLLAGISTAVLEGGDGPPVVLLHGPMGNAANWMEVTPLHACDRELQRRSARRATGSAAAHTVYCARRRLIVPDQHES